MSIFNTIKSDLIQENSDIKLNNKKKSFSFKPDIISLEQFYEIFQLKCNNILLERKSHEVVYTFSDVEKNICNRWYDLFTKSDMTNKGFCIYGDKGCGKTIMLLAIHNIHKTIAINTAQPVPFYVESLDICDYDVDYLINKQILYVNDLGREPKENNDYGNKTSKIANLILKRAENGTITHCTTNAQPDTLKESLYGKTIGSRFDELFEFIQFKGVYRRNDNN